MKIEDKLQQADNIIRELRQLRRMRIEYSIYRDHDQLKKCKIQEKKVVVMIRAWMNRDQGKLFKS